MLRQLPVTSARLQGWFRAYARRYVTAHFHAVRLSREGGLPSLPPGPIIVVLNHPSWWDPLLGMVLTGLMPDRAHFAPWETAALRRYMLFDRLGFFGVEPGTVRGARNFLSTADAILAHPHSALWVTAQGRFADPRERPVRLRGGVGRVASRLASGGVVPLALEYPFWTERTPEALISFGTPLAIEPGTSPDQWTARIEAALEATQDALATDAIGRDPARFDTILPGRSGVGGLYDVGRGLRAWWRGERFRAEHGGEASA